MIKKGKGHSEKVANNPGSVSEASRAEHKAIKSQVKVAP
jgi:hypothetical protein